MKLKCGDSEANHKPRWSQDKEQICPVFTLYLQHIFRISTHFFINNLVSTVSNPFFRLSSHYLSNNFFCFTGCPTVSVSTLIAYIFGICWWYEISYLQLNYLWIRFSPRDCNIEVDGHHSHYRVGLVVCLQRFGWHWYWFKSFHNLASSAWQRWM